MDKSKRQALKEIKKRKLKDIAKTAAKKLAAVWVISSMLVVNVPTGFTMAAFVDREDSKVNSISAGTLDVKMEAASDFAPDLKPTINATKDIDLSDLGSTFFSYSIKSGNLTGDLCSNLNLKADLDGINQYTGPIENFDISLPDFSAPEAWHFEASLEADNYALQGKTCNLDFLVSAKQKDLIGGVGFSDEESMANIINTGTWTIKGVWIQTTVDDFNAGVSSLHNGAKEILVTPATDGTGDAQIATGGVIPPQFAGFSGSSDNNHLPALAIDGSFTKDSYWHAVKAADGDYFWVDLGQLYPVSKIRITFAKNPPKDYQIVISTNSSSTGTIVADVKNNTNDIIEHAFAETSVRYAIIKMPRMNGNPAIFEFEILKRELPAFDGIATLTSQTFNSDNITKWVRLEWGETLLTGTDINFSIQTSNDGTNWSPWQLKAGTSPIDLSSLPQTRYIRWETELTTNTLTPPISTPVLHEARVYYEQENAQYGLVMNEFLPNPEGILGGTDYGQDADLKPFGEWIEIYNNGTAKIDLSGFYFKNSTDGLRTINAVRTNTGSTVIGPGEWLVFYTGQETSPEFLNNAGETITFYDLMGNIIDSYSYSGPVAGNKSFARIPDGTGSWVDPIPTPGTANIAEEQIPEQTFLEELIQTVTSTLAVIPEILGETTTTATTTQETTSTESTSEPATEETPAETPIPEEPVVTQEEQVTTEETPAPQEPTDIPEEQPAITPETPTETPAPESAPAETAPETNSSTN